MSDKPTITIRKITGLEDLKLACESTFKGVSNIGLKKMYAAEHSPVRSQMFWITWDNLPLFVSTHLLRHHVGSQPFAMTHRVDRKGGADQGRLTPTKLTLLINAQSLIDMAKMRLCFMASKETIKAFKDMKTEMFNHDADLARMMVVKCVYRNGLCGELGKCKYNLTKAFDKEVIEYRKNFKPLK